MQTVLSELLCPVVDNPRTTLTKTRTYKSEDVIDLGASIDFNGPFHYGKVGFSCFGIRSLADFVFRRPAIHLISRYIMYIR